VSRRAEEAHSEVHRVFVLLARIEEAAFGPLGGAAAIKRIRELLREHDENRA